MNNATQEKWDRHYQAKEEMAAVRVVAENLHLLPASGRGLELACGLAANAFLLAENGIEMDAWDISPVAIEKVNARAAAQQSAVRGQARDVVKAPPTAAGYDLVVVSRFLDRTLTAAILKALKPGGLLFYQTYTRTKVSDEGPGKAEWRLADNELLSLFGPMQILVYREEGCVGDTSRGFRNEALLVARKLA
ncbi:MAG TPA: class I SAM-dependent methyltransferase [Candidatus Tenderia sp.]|nr:class I SAM-dependent methyltransferase [Candidatus Tenderia sp.]